MNTIEGNKLIAKFDGCWLKYPNHDDKSSKYSLWLYPRNHVRHARNDTLGDMKYHSSWDWQIPVWNKIYELCTTNFKLSLTKYYEQEKGLHSAIRLNQPEISIPYLIDLIEWYNSEQSVKESDTSKASTES